MKNIIVTTYFLLMGVFSNAQTAPLPKTETETRALLCHEWKLSKAIMGGKTIKMDSYHEFYLVFYNEGKVTSVKDGKHDDMKWLLTFKNKELIMYGDKKELLSIDEKTVISTLNNKLLVLAYYEKNKFVSEMYFTKVR